MSDSQDALRRVAAGDPELAARLVLMALPVAASRIPGELDWVLDVHNVGQRRVSVSGGKATVEELDSAAANGKGEPEFNLWTEPATLVEMVTGAARPLRLMLSGRVRIRGKRRRALRLRHMAGAELSMSDAAGSGLRARAGRALPVASLSRGPRLDEGSRLHGAPSGHG